MSKKLKNYTDVTLIADRYGADALRYYLLSSPLIRGEDLNFTDRGVEEISKKLITRLDNVRSFYKLYADGTKPWDGTLPLSPEDGKVRYKLLPLDRWVLTRLSELIRDTTLGYETYELDMATRPLAEFIDDLSVWYLRRSRDRFKGEAGVERENTRFPFCDERPVARRFSPIR